MDETRELTEYEVIDLLDGDDPSPATSPRPRRRPPPRRAGRERVSLRRRVPDGQLGPTGYRPVRVRDPLF
ncbi:hypothetical protein ACIA98_34455 [Streptomyces sp. NPDC051366]|uniref:hypothetical protein n=1 Tax=Streptomyces sp. NPDC051366 TaxID=3365652 RepID=UPI0037A843EB